MKFGFVAKHRGAWPVNLMCEALGVSRGGFYAWLTRPRSRRSLSDEVLGAQVHQSFMRSDRTYGARRVWHDVLEQGQTCGLHRIERLMREQALRARPRRRGLPKDRGARSAVADNVLDRQFQADGPNQKWVADFSVPQISGVRDEGRSLAIGLQEQVANPHERLGSKAPVVSVMEKVLVRHQVWVNEGEQP